MKVPCLNRMFFMPVEKWKPSVIWTPFNSKTPPCNSAIFDPASHGGWSTKGSLLGRIPQARTWGEVQWEINWPNIFSFLTKIYQAEDLAHLKGSVFDRIRTSNKSADQDFAIRNCCTCWYAYMPEPLAKQARKSLKLAVAGRKIMRDCVCGWGMVWCSSMYGLIVP